MKGGKLSKKTTGNPTKPQMSYRGSATVKESASKSYGGKKSK